MLFKQGEKYYLVGVGVVRVYSENETESESERTSWEIIFGSLLAPPVYSLTYNTHTNIHYLQIQTGKKVFESPHSPTLHKNYTQPTKTNQPSQPNMILWFPLRPESKSIESHVQTTVIFTLTQSQSSKKQGKNTNTKISISQSYRKTVEDPELTHSLSP